MEIRVVASAEDGSVSEGHRLRLFGGAPATAQAKTRAVDSANHSLIQQLKEARVRHQRHRGNTRLAPDSHTRIHWQKKKPRKEGTEVCASPICSTST